MKWANHPLPVMWRPITAADAPTIASWRYEAPYDFYDLGEDAIAELLDPSQNYLAAVDDEGELIGFACFGESAHVGGGREAGFYTDPALDIGLGLRPDLTGQGHGAAFVTAVVAVGRERFKVETFRLSVAAFNERAIRAYRRAGFVPRGRFVSVIRSQLVEFMVMGTRPSSGVEADLATRHPLGIPGRTG